MSSALQQELELLDSHELDPTVPAFCQLWQVKDEERGGGKVLMLDRVEDGFVYFTPGHDHYITVDNLRRYWRCVDHLPRALLWIDGRFIRSWREMAIAAQIMMMTQGTRSV